MGGAYLVRKGGDALNFKVIAVADVSALPVGARENTIAVVTGVAIGACVIDSVQPTGLQTGDVYIRQSMGTTQWVFDAVKSKRTDLFLRITGVLQMGASALELRKAFLYKDGVWAAVHATLYERGNEFPAISGGWALGVTTGQAGGSKYASSLYMWNGGSTWYGGLFYTGKMIDLTSYTTLTVHVLATNSANVEMRITAANPAALGGGAWLVSGYSGYVRANIAHVTGLYYITLSGRSMSPTSYGAIQIDEVFLT